MKYLKKSSESEMITVFLQAEVSSLRFGDKVLEQLTSLGVSRSLIDNPDLSNNHDNQVRKSILSSHKGYGKNAQLFENFPQDVNWKWVGFSRDDLAKVKYINYDYWNELSGGSRLAIDASRNVQKGMTVFEEDNQAFLDASESLRNGAVFPPMIFVSTHDGGSVVALEGHLRLTVYMMESQLIPDQTKVIVGYSPDFVDWDLF